MTKFILLALILATNFTFAETTVPTACRQDFAKLQDKQSVKLRSNRRVTVKSEADIAKLRRVEAQAVKDYRKYVDNEIPAWGFKVLSQSYRSIRQDETLGYRVIVDGGDEAVVRFYYRLDMGLEDVVDRLLYFFWDNQSPVREWICDGYTNPTNSP